MLKSEYKLCIQNVFLRFTYFRNDTFTEKSKIKKWNIVPFNKKLKLRGIMEGLPLTQEGICQVYQLIEYLKSGDSKSKFFTSNCVLECFILQTLKVREYLEEQDLWRDNKT